MSDDFPNRQTIRLTGYDYSQNGYYFVTVCAHERRDLFGNIIDVGARTARRRDAPDSMKKIMQLNKFGKIMKSVLNLLPKRFPVKMDIYQIMPNHIHLILIMANESGGSHMNHQSGASRLRAVRAPTECVPTLGFIVGLFKSESTKLTRKLSNNPKLNIFQRNFYDRIIRSEREYKQIVYYIRTNPDNWEKDDNYV